MSNSLENFIERETLLALEFQEDGFLGFIPLLPDMKLVAADLAKARDNMALLNGLVNVRFRRPNAFEVDYKGLLGEVAFQHYARRRKVLESASALFAVVPPPGADVVLHGGAIVDIKGYLAKDAYFRINADKHNLLCQSITGYTICRETACGQAMEVHWFSTQYVTDNFKLKPGPYNSPYYELKAPTLREFSANATANSAPNAPSKIDLTATLIALEKTSNEHRLMAPGLI